MAVANTLKEGLQEKSNGVSKMNTVLIDYIFVI